MRFVVVTGMSGSGKQTAMKMLEDMSYYCVDNLPAAFVPTFAELILQPGSEMEKVALGLDIRSDGNVGDIMTALAQLRAQGVSYETLFMDAEDGELLKRYSESRRVHPMTGEASVKESIQKERTLLQDLKKSADYVIDTTSLLTRDLKSEMEHIFVKNEEYNSLMVQIMSFGFKNGIPLDADLVFDVRFLNNPYYIEELKMKTGLDKEVYEYVLGFEEATTFLEKLADLLNFLIPNYIKEGKHRLVIAIGCTGGKHRSVTLAGALYDRVKDQGNYGITLSHRDLQKR